MTAKALTVREILKFKKPHTTRPLHMLTCYDFQTAQLLNQTDLDLILVGDSLGNIILGLETTIPVTIEMMELFGRAVTRGASQKFVIVDMPFGSTSTLERGLELGARLFQSTKCQGLKIEGAFPDELKLIKRLGEIGIPVFGHIGLRPQSVHAMGGYYKHGKDVASQERLLQEALSLQASGVVAIVLECVEPHLAMLITEQLAIPTIGIGSGNGTDGQVMVINDLFQLGPKPGPSFAKPLTNLFELKKNMINEYIYR